MIALDTSLLIYAHRAALPEHKAARRAIQRAARNPLGWGIPLPCLAEFWAVVTHPASAGGPSRPHQAQAYLAALLAAGARIWPPGDGFWSRLTQLATDLEIRGPRIFDLQVALAAFDNGATELWTHDRRFTAFPGIKLLDPL